MTLADKWKQFTADPRAQKAGAFYKKAETGAWRVLDPIGKGANRLAGRVGAEGFWPSELGEGELEKAARILRTFTLDGVQADDDPTAEQHGGVVVPEASSTEGVGAASASPASKTAVDDKYASRKTQKVIRKIPPKALQGACGVAIFTCFRTGFGFSGASGSGVVVARLSDGSWGPPSGILIHTIGWGFLIGLDIYDVVLILRKPQALKAFEHPKVSIGGELSVSAGPVGNGAVLDGGVEAAPCWSYTKSKGAYAGVQLDGTVVLKRDDANARFYGQQVNASDILQGKVSSVPEKVKPLWQTLYAAEGRPNVLGTEQIPQGMAPGDTSISAEEAKELEAMGHDQGDQRAPAASSSTKRFVPPPLADHSTAASAPSTHDQTVPTGTAETFPAKQEHAYDALTGPAPSLAAQADNSATSAAVGENVFDDSHAVTQPSSNNASTVSAGLPPTYSEKP